MIGNRVTERDIRQWLNENGYHGGTAQFEELELHAIRRPGWEQVFRFRVHAKSRSGTRQTLFGCVKGDERIRDRKERTKVSVFESEAERQQQLDQWSKDLLTCKTGQTGSLGWTVALVIAVVLILAVVSRLAALI